MKRCTKCILPETYPMIKFDKDGVCNYCNEYKTIKYFGEKELLKLLEKYKGKGKYDCLVPVSGGRDSSYVLFQLTKKYKASVLAFNYNNGLVEKTATDNVKKAAEILGIDSIFVGSKRNIQVDNLRHIVKLYINKTPGHVQNYLCTGCRNGIWGGAYKIAKKYKIPLIIFGESEMEKGNFKRLIGQMYVPQNKDKIKSMITMPINFLQRKRTNFLMNMEFPPEESFINTNIKKVNFFEYEEWSEKKIVETIQNELNWNHNKSKGVWRFDCKIHALVNRMTYQILGMTEKDELYSKMIREGQITREEALEKLNVSDDYKNEEMKIIKQVVKELNLTKNENKQIISFCERTTGPANKW